MVPRARVSVWPGRRCVPGIVAPDSWGARGAECLPRDVLRHTLPTAVSLCNGPTACHGLCHRHGSGTTEARPPASSVPPAPHGGLGVLLRHLVNSGPDFRSSSSAEIQCPPRPPSPAQPLLVSSFHEKLYNRGSGHTTPVAPAAPPRHRAFLATAPAAGAPFDAR